jgi:hypothetical protein
VVFVDDADPDLLRVEPLIDERVDQVLDRRDDGERAMSGELFLG